MIDLRDVQAELSCARRTRIAVEAAETRSRRWCSTCRTTPGSASRWSMTPTIRICSSGRTYRGTSRACSAERFGVASARTKSFNAGEESRP